MKVFFVSFLLVVVTSADQYGGQQSECKILNVIHPGQLELPEFEVDGDGSPLPTAVLDPLPIKNSSITLKERILQGTFSLSNGVVEGLSTLKHDFNYKPIAQRITVNATLQRVLLTGIYEIVDGRANLTLLGEHTFSGKGTLNASAYSVTAALGFVIRINPETQHVSIADLSIDFDFANASIVAENLIVDGRPVQWEEVNQSIRPLYEELWQSNRDIYVKLVQAEINRLLEGCSLLDLIQLVKPPTQNSIEVELEQDY